MGICCIDEFDKMSESARSILHEVMEQQTVSIAKAGIIVQLNARTSILAASNPIDSRYNPLIPVTKNINLPPSLLSRFDLIYLILDIPEREKDIKLAKHLISLYWKEDEQKLKPKNFINAQIFQQYIAYSIRNFNPQIQDDAANELVNQYMKMRNLGRNCGKKTITATPRTLESIIRLSEALARIRHSHKVEVRDVIEATRLREVATRRIAIDPRTGELDMGLITSGITDIDRQILEENVKLTIEILDKETNMLLKSSDLLKKINEKRTNQKSLKYKDLEKCIIQLELEEKIFCDKQSNDPIIRKLK